MSRFQPIQPPNSVATQVRTARALDVVTDPVTGRPACRSAVPSLAGSNRDAQCVPYDIFSLTGVTPAALDYLQTPGFQNGEYIQQVVSASITGASRSNRSIGGA